MRITLITLNYNGAQSTIKLLESLQNQTDSDFSVIVADNDSSDIQQLRDYSAGKPIQIIENGANLGFAGGNNTALHQAFKNGANWALLINNDTWVESGFMARLKASLSAKEGIVGLPLNEGDRTAYAGKIEWLESTLQHHENIVREHESGGHIYYPIGGGLAISKQAYEKLGGLDENYFLYFEDADYAERTREAGVAVEFISEPIIHHSVSSTTGKLGSPLLLRYHYRNALYFNFKNAPGLYKILTIFWSVFIFAKQLIKLLGNNHPAESRAILAGIVDFYQERMGHISRKIKVGVECESIEGKNPQWGVGKIIMRNLEEISRRPELAKEFEFTLFFKDRIPDFPFLKSPIFKLKTVPVQGFPNRLWPIYYYAFLPIQLWFERLDVMFWPNYMLPIIAFGKSHVLLTEDIYYETHEGTLPFRYRLAYRIFGWWTAHFATKIMAISETSKKNIARLYDIDPNRIVVNYLGVDSVDILNKKEGDYILYVGQAFPRRHLKETIEAFHKIASEFTGLRLVAIGPDKYQTPTISPLVKKVNTELGREAVIHKDYVSQDELNRFYAEAKALVYVSDREAFGLPPMEALSFGALPIIADNALGHELFGDNAIFVSNPSSADSIAVGIREAMTNSALREKIKEHASEIVGRYTWKTHTDRFLNNIKSIAHHV